MTARLEKPIRRELELRGRVYIVELSRAGVLFREKGHRQRICAPIGSIFQLAERLAGEELHRDRLRDAALKRMER